MLAGMGVSLKNVSTASLVIKYTAYYILGRKQTTQLFTAWVGNRLHSLLQPG